MNNLIHLYRRKKKISQAVMARDLAVSPSYLCKVEKGSQEPSSRFIEECSRYLNCPVPELFPESMTVLKDALKSGKKVQSNNLWINRIEKKMKQYELAKMIGCSPSYLSRIEKGLQVPPENFKIKCSRVLRVKKDLLFPPESP